nr:unnamed protein product [Digitaria exilis]
MEARRGAPRAADRAQPGAVLDEGEAADNDAKDVQREVRPWPVLRLLCIVGLWSEAHFVEHHVCAGAAARDLDALPPFRAQTGRDA